MSEAAPAEYKVNDKVFILDMEWGRVFPAIITEVEDPKIWWTSYRVKLEETPGVHDELAFTGAAKPCPFSIPADKLFSVRDIFKTKPKAYGALLDRYEKERDELKERLARIPQLVRDAKKRLEEANKEDGSIYKLGATVWVIYHSYNLDPEVVESVVKDYDRGDFQSRPYYIVGKKETWKSAWYSVDQIYTTREDAVQALKSQLKAEYEKKLEAVE